MVFSCICEHLFVYMSVLKKRKWLELSTPCKVGRHIGLLHCRPLSCIAAEVKRSKLKFTWLSSALLACLQVEMVAHFIFSVIIKFLFLSDDAFFYILEPV